MGKNEGARLRVSVAFPLENFGVFLEREKSPYWRLRGKLEAFLEEKSQVTWLRRLVVKQERVGCWLDTEPASWRYLSGGQTHPDWFLEGRLVFIPDSGKKSEAGRLSPFFVPQLLHLYNGVIRPVSPVLETLNEAMITRYIYIHMYMYVALDLTH